MKKKGELAHRFRETGFCRKALKAQRIVHGNDSLARALCKVHALKYYQPGKVILTQGEGTNYIAFILAGKVLVKRNNREIAERGANECVGEMALIDAREKRSATVIAKEECVLARVSEPDFSTIAKKHPDLWRCLAIQNAERLRERLQGVRPRNDVPHVFIGSSKESLVVAVAAKKKLARVAETTIWTKGVFGPDKLTIEALAEQAQKVDFAVMVFGPDDVIFSRGNRLEGPRDNVVFELGLFMGALSRKRAFVISPKEKRLKVPSDLLGINFVNYNSRPKQNLGTSVGDACKTISRVIREHGPI